MRFFDAAVVSLRAIEKMPNAGSPRVGDLCDIPGLRVRRVTGFPGGWFYFVRPDHADVVRLLSDAQDLRRIPLARMLVGLRDYQAGDLTIWRAITSGGIEVSVDGCAQSQLVSRSSRSSGSASWSLSRPAYSLAAMMSSSPATWTTTPPIS